VRFEEREAVVELHVERIFPVEIPRVFDRRVLCLPKWFLTVLTVFTVDLLSSVLQ
jgi:hypothetical protein